MGTSESKIKGQILDCLNYNHNDRKFKKLLRKIPKKLDINSIRDLSGNTLVNLASQMDRKNVVQELIHLGVNINLCNDEGLTPIHQSINNSNEEITSLLLKHGANLNTLSEIHQTPLITAIQRSDDKLVELLLGTHQDSSGSSSKQQQLSSLDCVPTNGGGFVINTTIDINFSDNKKMTPLMWAAQEGNDGLVRFLLNCGADINKRDSQFRTAIYIAKSLNHHTTISILNEHFCKVNKIQKLTQQPSASTIVINNNTNNINNNQNNAQTFKTNNSNSNNNNNNQNNNQTFSPHNQTTTHYTQNETGSLASSWSSSDSLPLSNPTDTNNIQHQQQQQNININNNNQMINVQYQKPTSSSALDLDQNNYFNVNITTTTTTTTTQKHKRENSTLQSTISSSSRDEKYCKVCWERPADTVLLWCGHYAICFYCSQYLNNCPLCVQPIERVQRVFVS
ncbi:hypothetical protein DLAC_09347 [Tieghemostelium lacteum]|uniref:RING-type domain-containing protein n=1 Tax=Tieghemostelium lacteum TaxID=361077 RepID=A0A151Z9T3_TIELA|nr:hypothetical protein DLAC_09347 [Tieghemostelium lacteum]|eukprot:KYQ90712.1 hypothetical protein DLAC_09347 [Tieghemostelium lacteum]